MATLSSDKKYVTVVKGDTLSEIALTYKDYISGSTNEARIKTLVSVNDITNRDFIVVGQKIYFASGSSSSTTKSSTLRAIIKVFGLQSNTDRTVYATWNWSVSNTKEYSVVWYYDTGDGVWFIGSESTVSSKQCTYNAPSNAERVKFKVKPISKTRTVNKKETTYWTAGWSTERTYDFANNPPVTPAVPTVSIDDYYKLTATLDNLSDDATGIQFQVVKDDTKVFKSGKATIKTSSAAYFCTVTAGSKYKVRCRAYRGSKYSEWSEYSDNLDTIPKAPSGITTCKAMSETSVYLEWPAVSTAKTYELEYATEKRYLNGSDATQKVSGIETTKYEKTGLESGEEYFFRVRSVNDEGESAWSGIVSVIVGKDPIAPTTWSSTTTVITGEPLTLFWIHNAEDQSSQTYAEVEITIDGDSQTYTVKNSEDAEEKDKTSSYEVDTSGYLEGTKIQWRVRTAGITKTYGDWSTKRTVDVYAPPTLELDVTDVDGNVLETLTSFPFYVKALAGPNTQIPIGYHLSVTADEAYETVDQVGNVKMVNAGDEVYSKYFDTTSNLVVEFSAGNIDLENNIGYTVVCTVSMNSGLTAEGSAGFTVAWTDSDYEPNAEIGIDKETLVAYIRPHCPNTNTTLSVYRREYNGKFTELATGIDGATNTFITDPHPSLDFARYRIVAITKDTGAVTYADIPAFPVGETAVIIQWDEDWSSFDSTNEDELEERPWTGSMLRLPYNIDISDKYAGDVSLLKYIGRENPVSYYGTQVGETSSWKVEIEKSDKETLYAIRRLAVWKGDVYVREPSGSGYWANISISFSQTHCKLTIPITIEVTRVEGGA